MTKSVIRPQRDRDRRRRALRSRTQGLYGRRVRRLELEVLRGPARHRRTDLPEDDRADQRNKVRRGARSRVEAHRRDDRRDGPEEESRAEDFKEMAKKSGISVKDLYWTLGKYDVIAICEAPDDETATAFSLSVCSRGNVRSWRSNTSGMSGQWPCSALLCERRSRTP